MKREIKFKVWDPMHQAMETLEAYKVVLSDDLWWVDQHEKRFRNARLQDLVLLQYTGLKDGDGREIYEGDILRAEDGSLSSVEYDPGHFILRHHPNENSDFIASRNTFKVIGNIYQQPELLKNY